VGTTGGFFCLGLLTSVYLIRRFKIYTQNLMLKWVILLNVLALGLVFFIKRYISTMLTPFHLLIFGFILEGLLIICYLYFFYKKNARWILELKQRVFI